MFTFMYICTYTSIHVDMNTCAHQHQQIVLAGKESDVAPPQCNTRCNTRCNILQHLCDVYIQLHQMGGLDKERDTATTLCNMHFNALQYEGAEEETDASKQDVEKDLDLDDYVSQVLQCVAARVAMCGCRVDLDDYVSQVLQCVASRVAMCCCRSRVLQCVAARVAACCCRADFDDYVRWVPESHVTQRYIFDLQYTETHCNTL